MVRKYLELPDRHPVVQGNEYRTDAGAGKQELVKFRGVTAEKGDPVAFADTQFARQGPGQMTYLFFENCIADFLRAVAYH